MAHCISVTICKYQKDLEELHDKGYYFSVENGYAIIAINYELKEFQVLKNRQTRCLLSKRSLGEELIKRNINQYICVSTDSYDFDMEAGFHYDCITKKKTRCKTVNEALAFFGERQAQNKSDLFDTFNLGRYRQNSDLMNEEYIKKMEEIEKKEKEEEDELFYQEWLSENGILDYKDKLVKIIELNNDINCYDFKENREIKEKRIKNFIKGCEIEELIINKKGL